MRDTLEVLNGQGHLSLSWNPQDAKEIAEVPATSRNDIQIKAYNLHRNLDEERVSLIETVAVKPNFSATST